MDNDFVMPTGPRHYLCDIERDVAAWNKLSKSSKEKDCNRRKDMDLRTDYVMLSLQLSKTYGVSLDRTTPSAIRPYMRLKETDPQDAAFKLRVLKMIIKTLDTETDPFTKGTLPNEGMTEVLVRRIIKYCATGCSEPDKVRVYTMCSKRDLKLLNTVFDIARENVDAAGFAVEELDALRSQLISKRVSGLMWVA